jgi:hypothetical protein
VLADEHPFSPMLAALSEHGRWLFPRHTGRARASIYMWRVSVG